MKKLSTEFFETEGKQNVSRTIRIVAKAARSLDIEKVIVFASSAHNVIALRKLLEEDRLILAVTFPAGMTAKPDEEAIYIGMASEEDRMALRQYGIPLLQGIMPLRALGENVSPIVDAMTRVLDLWGGGLGLCVQATLMACDAGYLAEGERCIVMSADTALIMRAGNAFRFLKPHSRAAVEHILCKPLVYQITRRVATLLGHPEVSSADSVPRLVLESTPKNVTPITKKRKN